MVVVAVSGVGGTGKTSASKNLEKMLKDYKLVSLNDLAKKIDAYKKYDEKRKSNIVDMRKLKSAVRQKEKEHGKIIIEGLFAHEFDADIVIVLRCRPDVLEKRLKRKYRWKTKIEENREAEFMGIITQEATKMHKRVYEIDTTKKTAEQTARLMRKIIDKKPSNKAGKIDWTKSKDLKKLI